jgi:SAM-dependent methyltransferase
MKTLYETTADGQVWLKELQINRLEYPNEHVIRWIARARPRLPQQATALEIGYGSGQHLKLLMDYDLRTSGTELLDYAIDLGREIIKDHIFGGEIIKSKLNNALFLDGSFDALLAWGSVLSLQPKYDIEENLTQIGRILKPGGLAFFNLRTTDNWFFGLGKESPRGYWTLDQRAGAYAGANYTFLSEDNVRTLVSRSGLELENLERTDWWSRDLSQRHSWWLVHCKKTDRY